MVNDTLADGTIADSRLGTQTKRIFSIYNDSRISYNNTFNHIHQISARAGFRYLQSRIEQDFGLGANSATDELRSVGNGVATARRTGGELAQWKWLNGYFSTDYSLLNKYYTSLNVAVDGSSRFGNNVPGAVKVSGNSYAVMPSLAGAWLVSSENFITHNKVIDLLKLRASVGLTGNDDIGNYPASQTYISQNFLGMQGLVRSNFGNDKIQWEQVTKINGGVDAAFFNERLNITLDAYQNKTNKMLLNEPMPVASGFRSMITNTGAMKTTGVKHQ